MYEVLQLDFFQIALQVKETMISIASIKFIFYIISLETH